jgi:hypothetical protein
MAEQELSHRTPTYTLHNSHNVHWSQYLEHDGAERTDVILAKLAVDYLAEIREVDQTLPKQLGK